MGAEDKHSKRWARHHYQKMTPEEIAEQDRVSVALVKKSLAIVDQRRKANTIMEMEAGQIEIIQHVRDFEKTALVDALTATKESKDKDGKKVQVPDHQVRLAAMKEVTAKVVAVQPRLKGQQINIGVGVNGGSQQQPSGNSRASIGFEDILRKVRNQQALPPAPDPNIIDAEVIASEEASVGN